jgi:serine protease DegQ
MDFGFSILDLGLRAGAPRASRSIQNPKSKIQSLAALLFALVMLQACSSPARLVEPLPEPASDLSAVERAGHSVVALVVEQGDISDSYGAGIILDRQGHILTVHHVVDGATRIIVLLGGGYTVRASVIASDPVVDFAVLKAETWVSGRMRPADFANTTPRIGDAVWNIGNPFGTSRFGGEGSVGRGVISALHRTYLNEETGRLYLDAIQHDAPTNPGNSGGGVFNERGELLGLNALITTTRDTPRDAGVAFALPAPLVKQWAQRMLRGERITHGWLGAERFKQAAEVFDSGYGRLRAVFGPLAVAGPARLAGAMQGDVIIQVDGTEVYGLHEMLSLEDALVPGQQVKLRINRAGRELDLDITIGSRPWPVS